jgi:serine protease
MKLLPCSVALAGSLLVLPVPSQSAVSETQAGPPAQLRERAIVRPSLPFRLIDGVHRFDRVVVKFGEGTRVRLVDGRVTCLVGTDLVDVHAAIGDTPVERLFTRPVAELDEERAELQANVPATDAPLADLNNYFLLRPRDGATAEMLVNALNEFASVETCYAEHVPQTTNDIPPTTPQYESRQTYLNAAPSGFDYLANQSVVGARFQGRRMAHIEGGWVVGHEDCAHLSASNYVGAAPSGGFATSGWTYHGNSCVGIMAAGRNGYGMRGFGSDCARVFLSSIGNGSANMINQVAARLVAGDVMSSPFGWVLNVGGVEHTAPVDMFQAEYDAVRAATARGIHYTFSAGNSNSNLENTSIFGTRYLPTSLPSGGYVIGASGAGNFSRASFSSYGSIIAANGWGSGVASLGYGDLFNPGDTRQHFTATFGGTSAAAPIVAGVIASFVGAVAEQNGETMTPAQVLAALRSTGTTISGNIGRRPSLTALLATKGLPDGLVVSQDATPGTSIRIEVRGVGNSPFAMLLSLGRGRLGIGLNRDLLLDLTTMVPLANGTVSGAGLSTVVLPIPNNPTLRGVDVFLQSGIVENSTLKLTNSATAMVR